MSLDKAIKHGKEHRKGYIERGKSGEYDLYCRPGAKHSAMYCSYCERNRLFSSLRRVEAVDKIQDDEFYDWHEFKYDVEVDIAMSAMDEIYNFKE